MTDSGHIKDSKPKIMIVDDSKASLNELCSLLSETGKYQTICHNSPQSALNDIALNPPDIIICDLEMPDSHGYEFMQKIRENPVWNNIPILIITNQTDTTAMSKSIALGADAFCSKETIRYTIEPHLLSLLRSKNKYVSENNKNQVETIQTLIGTYKHEFGNSLAIVEGMLRKYKKEFPDSKNHACMINIDTSLKRIQETLGKLQELRQLRTEKKSETQKILKTG